jgi:anti-sigma regulatory factor (Ser/Thr protein kinase)
MEEVTAIAVPDSSYVSGARRQVETAARCIGMEQEDVGRAALVATELATNLARHGGGGQLIVHPISDARSAMLELIAIDRGPGIANVAESLRDGMSTFGVAGGSAGTGLGAIRRQSDLFDIHSAPGQGTAIVSQLWPRRLAPEKAPVEIGRVSVPKPGEQVCGDGIALVRSGMTVAALVVDGLGHGSAAHLAAEQAQRLFTQSFQPSPAAAVQRLHAGLRATRGAAVGVLTVDLAASRAVFCGVGNIAGLAAAGGNVRRFVSMNGIAGHSMGRAQEFVYPCDGAGLVIVMHSDGLTTSWDLNRYPGLAARHASLIAAILYRDASRGRDDSTVLVMKRAA